MKNLLTILITLFALTASAQMQITVSGHITQVQTGYPVPNHEVYITLMSNNDPSGGTSSVILTDSSGFYAFSGSMTGESGTLQVSTSACDGTTQGEVVPIGPNSPNEFIFDFVIACDGGGGSGCQANYTYYPIDNQTIQFINESFGDNLQYAWSFGDDTYSYEENPLKNFSYSGVFEVTLNISSTDSSCNSSFTNFIYIGDTIIFNCQASFMYAQTPNSNEVQFFDTSIGDPTTWIWDFGDNTVSYEQNPIHTYNLTGDVNVFTVTLTIQNADTSCNSTYSLCIYLGGTGNCLSQFQAMPNPTGNTVNFLDMSMGNPDSWFWDFGDGNSSTQQNPTYTYSQPGIYNACLSIYKADSSCFDMSCQTVLVGQSSDCLAQFTYYPDSLNYEFGLQFIDLSYGQLTDWSWSFGDGTASTEQNPMHIFAAEGIYEVCLTVSGSPNPNGTVCQSSWCEQVHVGTIVPPDCYNYFTYFTAGNSVQFEGFHSTDIPASYIWDFGDGITAVGNPITHNYPNTGIYYVTLTSWDDNNCSAISAQTVVVGDSMDFNQVYGQAFEGNWPLANGFAMIFSMESDTNYYPFFSLSTIDSMGIFTFPMVPNGEFALLAVPTTESGYLPTYYGNTIFWEDATPVIPGVTQNPCNINLVSAQNTMNPGNGYITGYISQVNMRNGFIDKINVLLMNENHQTLSFTEVAIDGSFMFTNLAYGTYFIYPELTGVNSDYIRVDVTESQNSGTINLSFADNNFLGSVENQTDISVGDIFPNPVNDIARIIINSDKISRMNVMIYDLSGRMISEKAEQISTGINTIEITVNNLESGIYFMKAVSNNGTTFTRKIVKE